MVVYMHCAFCSGLQLVEILVETLKLISLGRYGTSYPPQQLGCAYLTYFTWYIKTDLCIVTFILWSISHEDCSYVARTGVDKLSHFSLTFNYCIEASAVDVFHVTDDKLYLLKFSLIHNC